ncbi:MAG: nitric oxide synthase oxygenase [Chthoniobacterales bacterium]
MSKPPDDQPAPMVCPFTGKIWRHEGSALRPVAGGGPVDRASAAEEFLRQFATETGFHISPRRIETVRAEISARGCYRQTPEELEFACRLAWRNNRRCIGRRYWQTLEVADAREAKTAGEIFDACVAHLRRSTNGGKIRPLITVFAPADGRGLGPLIHNYQLIRYAGYREADGSVLGDPAEVAFTSRLINAGWRPPEKRGAFDLLPLLVETPGEGEKFFEWPADAVLEVPMTHPSFGWFAELGLKWHALPAVSNMALETGGATYPAAPFSGYYMETEIAARNFGDTARYNLLPVVADRMDPSMRSKDPFWRDRALVELCAAVLHSFRQAGVTIVDHHAASRQFMDHLAEEKAQGRVVPGDWSWLVPPVSGSASPVFHRSYDPRPCYPDFVPRQKKG